MNRESAFWTSPLLQSALFVAGPTLVDPPLLGFVHLVPLRRQSAARPLPERRNAPSSTWFPPVRTFRPRGFSPPRRFTPQQRCQVYCNLIPARVRCVSVAPSSLCPASQTQGCMSAFPATCAPLEEPSSSTAVPHHCGQCPPAVIVSNHRGCARSKANAAVMTRTRRLSRFAPWPANRPDSSDPTEARPPEETKADRRSGSPKRASTSSV